MNVLITGSEGFIGSRLCSYLEEKGYDIIGFDIKNGSDEDVGDYESLERVFKNNSIDFVVHLAAEADVWCDNYSKVWRSNIKGVKNVGRLCERFNVPLLFTSSITEDDPRNLYSRSKRIGSLILEDLGCESKVVKLSNVVGSGTNKGQVSAMIEQALEEGRIEVWGNGEIIRSFVYVEDVCKAIWFFIEGCNIPEVLGSLSCSNICIAEFIAGCFDKDVSIKRVSKLPPSPKKLVCRDTIPTNNVFKGIKEQIKED